MPLQPFPHRKRNRETKRWQTRRRERIRTAAIRVETYEEGFVCLVGVLGSSLDRKLIKEFKQRETEVSLAVFVFEAVFLLLLTMISLEQHVWASAQTLPSPSPVSLIIATAWLLKTHRLVLAWPMIYSLQGFAEQLTDSRRPRTKVFKDSGSFVAWCELQTYTLEFVMAAGRTCGLVGYFNMCWTCWRFMRSVCAEKCIENLHWCGSVSGLCQDFIQSKLKPSSPPFTVDLIF